MSEYPSRDPCYAHRYVRVLHKSCAAQDIGQAACYLCCIIAHTEDAGRYAGPARFWNSQLMETMGFRSPKQLDIARDKAVAAGWLAYRRTGNRSVGEYHVTIPDRFASLSDGPIEPIHSANGTNSGMNTGKKSGTNGQGIIPNLTQEGEGYRNEFDRESGKPSYLYPIPNKKRRGKAATKFYSVEFERFWNAFPEGRRTKKPDAWVAYRSAIEILSTEHTDPHSFLAQRVAEYAASDQGRGPYVRGPAPWLNQQAWNDPPAAWRGSDHGNGHSRVDTRPDNYR